MYISKPSIKSCFLIILFILLLTISINIHSQDAESLINEYKPALVSIWTNFIVIPNYRNYDYDYDYDNFNYGLTFDTTMLLGSGFFIREDGLIGTNYHVVEMLDSIIVKTSDSTFYNAVVLSVDERNDIAILKITNAGGKVFPVVKLGNSDNVRVGEDCFAIGSPLGYEYTISNGIVAGIRENQKVEYSKKEVKNFDKVIQITAGVAPGNSGGALFNDSYEVIGITTYTAFRNFSGNLNFAVCINSLKDLMESLSSPDAPDLSIVLKERRRRFVEFYFSNNYTINSVIKKNMMNLRKYDVYYDRYQYRKKNVNSSDENPPENPDSIIIKADSLTKIYNPKFEQLYRKSK